ncbi:MAG: sigma factor, partial [Acidobacteriota bacterium]
MKRPDSSFPDSSSPHSTPAAARRPRERPPRARGFATTQWSLVLAAHPAEAEQQTAAREALDTLCRAYWYPLYAFARSRGHGPEEAQDLTQAFFARLLEKESLARADPERGRFRSFLLGAMKNFMANEWHRRRATKRGGGVIFTDPDALGASLSGVAAAERDPEARYGAAAGRRGTDPELEFDREW